MSFHHENIPASKPAAPATPPAMMISQSQSCAIRSQKARSSSKESQDRGKPLPHQRTLPSFVPNAQHPPPTPYYPDIRWRMPIARLGSGDTLAVILCWLGRLTVAGTLSRTKQAKEQRALGMRIRSPRGLPRGYFSTFYWRIDLLQRPRHVRVLFVATHC